jgi:hypothetical protein
MDQHEPDKARQSWEKLLHPQTLRTNLILASSCAVTRKFTFWRQAMDRTRVSSSHLASVGYDPTTRILEVEFLDRSIYQYSNVPEHLYHGLMSASSDGSYLDAHIKKGGYTYRRVR